jgi:hypothetical protein
MTCDLTYDLTCDSVPASSCQRKGMRCHDDAGTESQVITHGHDASGHSPLTAETIPTTDRRY